MPSLTERKVGPRYWRSVEELADSPKFQQFLETEFPNIAKGMTAATRRQFLKIMGASFALAGMTGCRWPKEQIVPYADRPDGRTPGVPEFYATSFDLGGVATGLLAKSYDGRPIKVEGNPDHPNSLGGTSAVQQASVLGLYDPDRSKRPMRRVNGRLEPQTFAQFDQALPALFGSEAGAIAVLAEASSSPVLGAARERFLTQFPQARWYEWEPLSRDNEREGTRIAFGAPYRPHLDLAKADVILSFDDDFLLEHPAALRYTRQFAARRTAEETPPRMNRLYVIESNYSVTGSNADHRFAERSSDIPRRLVQLAAELVRHGLALPSAAADGLGSLDVGEAPAYLADIAGDLLAHKGRTAIMVGPRQPAEAHALAALLNRALDAAVAYTAAPDPDRQTHARAITELAQRMAAGEIGTLLMLGGNPVYDAPADLDFAGALAKVPHAIHLSLYVDETSRRCEWHVPQAHYLESWDLGRSWDGALSVVQPLIAPLYDGRTPAELVSRIAGEDDPRGHKLSQDLYAQQFHQGGNPEGGWRQALHDGIVAGTAWKLENPPAAAGSWTQALDGLKAVAGPGEQADRTFEVVFVPDKLYDGRFANNAWLQELPHPLSKLTWDNAAYMSPADAQRLGVRQDDMVQITVPAQPGGGPSRKLRLPVYVLPGHARGSITLPLGYGRSAPGDVGDEAGFDTYRLRTSAALHIATGATVERTGGAPYALATTQDHHSIASEVGEAETQQRIPRLVREATLKQYQSDPHVVAHFAHALPLIQPFADHDFPDRAAWGMAIDLSKCTGCGACVVACQAENNIPVVGKREVAMGREMHWIRVDRYFKGDPAATRGGAGVGADGEPTIEVRHQPMTCVQCENAPCEQVCPVAATVHDEEGLNVMVYNRCIGTRYCLNNCPYKVRRFNWFWNHHGPYHPRSRGEWRQADLYEVEKMVYNPEVTVRSRGVMEKCTYCVQRITLARIEARNAQVQGRGDGMIPDGAFTTACAQACPAEAIVFGDLRRPDSRVKRLHDSNRTYAVLEDLNVRPRGKYLMSLTNPLREPAGHDGHGQGAAADASRSAH